MTYTTYNTIRQKIPYINNSTYCKKYFVTPKQKLHLSSLHILRLVSLFTDN